MAFIEPMHRNKPNITYLLLYGVGPLVPYETGDVLLKHLNFPFTKSHLFFLSWKTTRLETT